MYEMIQFLAIKEKGGTSKKLLIRNKYDSLIMNYELNVVLL